MNPISTIATAVVTVLTNLMAMLPSITTTQVGSVINLLVQLIPIVVQEATDLIQPIKNIIAALNSNGSVTPEQMANLAALDAQCDTAFEAAAAAAGLPPDTP